MKRFTVFAFLLWNVAVAQDWSDQVPALKRYDPEKVVDPTYGITMYNELIFTLGGDSVRYDKKGYNVQGWIEDYYTSGKVIHKGYYIDGQLKAFKNYYENGQIERSYRSTDFRHSEMLLYFSDGKIKSEVIYLGSKQQKETDYYPNGNIEFTEELDKDGELLLKRNTFYESGVPESSCEITDKRKKLFTRKDFYESGKLKEEGPLKYHPDLHDYLREGEWKFYKESGELIKKENYVGGKVVD